MDTDQRTISDEATSDSELSSTLLRAARGDTNLILMGVASAVPLILARSHTIVSVQLAIEAGRLAMQSSTQSGSSPTRVREATPRGKHACEQLRACLEVDARLQMARAAYASSLLSRCKRTYIYITRWWALIGTTITAHVRTHSICAGACVIELIVGIAVGSCCRG